MMLVAPPLSLYVHLPWCIRKCPYCDFNSHVVPAAGLPESAYLHALLEDLDLAARDCGDRELVSVFFGGGTPSLFTARAIERVLERAATRMRIAPDLEVTLEANPGAIERGRFVDYRAAGVNRVSLGAQSFDDGSLAALGRIHASRDTVVAVEELHAAGIDNFNLDLMYALPQQTVEGALDDLQRALALEPTHVSHYQLTLEPGTAFERRPPSLPDEDTAWTMQLACQSMLAEAGYPQYEVSAYSRPARQCRHNLNYWLFGDYLGIGAGAHGKLTDAASGRIMRTARVRTPGRYMSAAKSADRIEESRSVPVTEVPFEFFLNALRLTDGFAVADFETRTGLAWMAVASPLKQAVSQGLLEATTAGHWAPTALGRRFLNDLHVVFLPIAGGSARSGSGQGLATPSEIG